MLTLEGITMGESSKIQIIASEGFTERMDEFKITTFDCTGLGDLSFNQDITIYPNPVSGIFNLQFSIFNLQRVTLKIYDLLGREVATVMDGVMPPGEHVLKYDARHLPTGIYLLQKSETRKQQSAFCKLVIVK